MKLLIIFFIAGSKKNCYHNQSSNYNHCCYKPLLQCLLFLLQTAFFTLFFFILYATLHVISAISFLSTSFGIAPLIFKCFLAFLFCHIFYLSYRGKKKIYFFLILYYNKNAVLFTYIRRPNGQTHYLLYANLNHL